MTCENELTTKSDIYSLGITLYQAITGDNPFDSERASVSMFRQVNLIPPALQNYDKGVSEYFSGAVFAMLEKNPAQRPSEEELEEVFASLVEYNQCREDQVNAKQKAARSQEAVSAASNQLLVAEEATAEHSTERGFTPAPQAKIASIEKRLGQMPLYRRQAKKLLKSLKRSDPRIIALSAAFLLVSTAAGWAGYHVFSDRVPVAVIQGPMTAVICIKCNLLEERRVKEITEAKCSKCEGPIAMAEKCENCKHVFALPELTGANNMTPEEYSEAVKKTYKCPKCGTDEISAVPLTKETSDL